MHKPTVFISIQKRYHARSLLRRGVIEQANQALSYSKQAIFAFHREEMDAGKKKLEQANKLFLECEKHIKKFPDLKEGAYKAALEEYAEALLFQQYLENGKIGSIDPRAMEETCYLGGLCDMTGEIVRYAMLNVTKGRPEKVEHAFETVEMVIDFLLEIDLTGYLRTKFDQAKNNLRRLEQVLYDLSLRS
ncbi:hypothetical protein A2239_03295 [Candidatus Uhrbacteria bacterium RIFOXYA2_FULL_40_9]|nr:MAG: hypothetical protein UT94_C0037G0010 [Candidatus Uhrbacteria bacterium GW2011_GWF2_40_263]OGL94307.1 MAG: hypothetical protein A2239_03295 [Candidatus Uhrbacteria bacterium RIFOXYA2_FULL_40_9]OGL96528.1 MAG: hypothetical protein A2332_00940 [Candidatus Uhrbacteria bacterium RIFOXYB2_FULL_41_18]HBK35055.1 hypothetical protein [Candidatus Uhrbacteria bacterium]HCB55599.1 hypothetical protein [Candidatus Uhrbacteria bacterium]